MEYALLDYMVLPPTSKFFRIRIYVCIKDDSKLELLQGIASFSKTSGEDSEETITENFDEVIKRPFKDLPIEKHGSLLNKYSLEPIKDQKVYKQMKEIANLKLDF